MDIRFASILYWSRSPLNGAAWLPCMLSLDGSAVELFSERGVELRCPASDLVVEVTGLGNLRLISAQGSFVLSVIGGTTVPLPLPALEKRLRSFRPAGSPGESLMDPVTQWHKLIVTAGAHPRGRTRSHLRLLLVLSASALVAVFTSLALLIGYVAAR